MTTQNILSINNYDFTDLLIQSLVGSSYRAVICGEFRSELIIAQYRRDQASLLFLHWADDSLVLLGVSRDKLATAYPGVHFLFSCESERAREAAISAGFGCVNMGHRPLYSPRKKTTWDSAISQSQAQRAAT